MKNTLCYILFALFLCIFYSFDSERRNPVIYMIGDSTMADKPLSGGNPERGWGQMLPGFFTPNVCVENRALNGRSSRSFRNEGHWDPVRRCLRKGDYVFIQFGHNDQKMDTARHSDADTDYKANLRKYIDETREVGAIPVLFTPIVRRKFNKEGMLLDTHGRYADAVKDVAAEKRVQLIDLNRLSAGLLEKYGEEKSTSLFVWVNAGTCAALPKGKQDNTHLNVRGAREIARMVAGVIKKTIPELSSHVIMYDYVVAKDGSGDFFTVQDAINAIPDFRKKGRTTVYIREGVYKEKLILPESKINVSFIGESLSGTVLTYDDYASKKNIFGEEMSTSGSASFYVYAPDFIAENLTFENSAGPVGQAVAVLVSGDRVVFRSCRFLGFQDTLYTYNGDSRQYYENCYIEGTVDFIFGKSTVWFESCTIHSKRSGGYLTAAATPEEKAFGYVFYECRLTADNMVVDVYLGRPWRPFARTLYIGCDMGKHISPAGWNNWKKPDAEKTVFYGEYRSRGEGGGRKDRVVWSHQLTRKEADRVTLKNVLGGEDGWNPQVVGILK
ncbi:pectinesterase family protein [Coprobacter sp.]